MAMMDNTHVYMEIPEEIKANLQNILNSMARILDVPDCNGKRLSRTARCYSSLMLYATRTGWTIPISSSTRLSAIFLTGL